MVGFGQGAFTVVAPVADAKVAELRDLLGTIRAKVHEEFVPLSMGEPPGPADPALLTFNGVENLHFGSLVLIPLGERTALLFEGNIDGEPGAFLDRLAQTHAPAVANVFGLCEGFDPARAGEYLKRHDKGVNTFYVGCPGRTIGQVRDEQKMRDAMEEALDATPPGDPKKVGLQQKGAGPYVRPFLVRYGPIVLNLALGALGLVLLLVLVGLWKATPWAAILFVLLVGGFLAWAWTHLRHLEGTDRHDPNTNYNESVDECLKLEDYGISNHFASVTEIRPGLFRLNLLRFVLFAIHWLAVTKENKGQLAGIPSIHFARWTILENRHLLFLSNFDGSWEHYLNDFIDMGHSGLTGVWSNTLGFPPTEGLLNKGATYEQNFKVYARNSQVPTLVWYRAYPDGSTRNIENNTRIREGLHTTMTNEEEARWRIRL